MKPRHIFLIDSIGALISAVSLGLVLTTFQHLIGMPTSVLQMLASIACFFAVYSFIFFCRTPANWLPFLRTIAMANFCYCLLTTFLVIQFYEDLTFLGIIYFVAEVIIIIALVALEWKYSKVNS